MFLNEVQDITYIHIKHIFIIYIITLLKMNIITINTCIYIFFLFYKNNFNLLDDGHFFIKIMNNYLIEQKEISKLTKYLTFIYVISTLNSIKLNFINLLNKSKLYKMQKKKLIISEEEIYSDNLHIVLDTFNKTNDEILYLNKYIKSYEFISEKPNIFKLTLIKPKNIFKPDLKFEIINRIELLKENLGISLLEFILKKKDRKKDKNNIEYLELYDYEYLSTMSYDEILKYSFKLFYEIDNNLIAYSKDFEFLKYLKLIIINYFENFDDKISIKLFEKLLKKYIVL